MAELRLEVEVAHPAERVWRALTDAELLGEWFMPTDLEPDEGSGFTLEPGELAGFLGPISGELTELSPPHRMVMLWQGEKLHTRVTWELVEVDSGCQLRVVQSGFIGTPATVRRRALRATYTRLFAEQLPAVLDRLAADEEIEASGAVPPAAVPRQRSVPADTSVRAWSPSRWVEPAESLAASSSSSNAGPDPAQAVPAPAPAAAAPAAAAPAAVPAQRDGRDPTGPTDLSDPTEPAEPTGAALPWYRRLAVVPAWGRALAIGGAAAVVAVALLAGISQTAGPRSGAEDPPAGQGAGRDGPGMGAQPEPGASRSSAADDPDASPGPAGGAGAEPSGSADGSPGPTPAPGDDPDPGSDDPSPGGPGQPESTPAPGDQPPPDLSATVTTSASGLLGLGGREVEVAVSNPGPGEAEPWEVRMDVDGQTVTEVSGATYQDDGGVAVFTPSDGLAVGDTAEFSFHIPGLLGLGASDPTDCEINSTPC